jgi:hypothetical protein
VGVRFSAPVQTGPGAHLASCTMGTGSFPGEKSDRSVTLTPHPLLVTLVMKELSYTSTRSMNRTACTEPQCLYKGALYLYLTVELYLHSPYGPYGLYSASVQVQGCTLPYGKITPFHCVSSGYEMLLCYCCKCYVKSVNNC